MRQKKLSNDSTYSDSSSNSTASFLSVRHHTRRIVMAATLFGVGTLLSPLAEGAPQTWDGGAATNSLNDAANWTGDALPSGSGDTGTWDATVPGNLALTWTSAGFGNSTNGFNINIAATHTGTLSLDSVATTGSFALGTITIANGAGAFSLGTGTGDSNVVFRGTNTFTNNDDDTAIFKSDIRYASGGGTIRALTFNGSGNFQIDSVFKPNQSGASGAFTVTKSGTGTLALNANNTGNNGSSGGNLITGLQSVTIQQGTVLAGATGALGGGGSLGNGTVVTLGASGSNNATLLNTGAFTQANTITVASGNTGTLTLGGNHATGTSVYTGNVNLNSNAVLSAATGGQVNFTTGVIAGAGAATISGGGTVLLSGANTYTGGTTVSAGKLLVTNTTGTATGTGGVTLTGGTLDGTGSAGAVTVNGGSVNLANGNGTTSQLTLGSLAFTTGGTVNARLAGGGTTTAAIKSTGALTTNGNTITVNFATPTASFVTGTPYDVISYGTFSGSTSNFVVGSGIGARASTAFGNSGTAITFTITAIDTIAWSGLASQDWTTAADGNNSAPNAWATVNGHANTNFWAADIVNFGDTYDNTNSGGGVTAVTNSNVNIIGNVNPVSTNFNNSLVNYTLAGAGGIANGTLSKSGSGTVTIQTSNTYTSGTTFTGGTLVLNSNAALGTGAININAGSSKTLDSTSGAVLASNAALNVNDDFSFTGTSNLDLGTGTATLGGAGAVRTLNVNAGVLSVGELKSTTHGLTKQGAGTLVLSSVGDGGNGSQIAGALNIQGGTVQFNRNGATVATSGDLVIPGLSGTGTLVNGAATERWVYIDTTVDSTFDGSVNNGPGAALGLYKNQAGTLTLNGTNNYTGTTTLQAGRLVLNGANTGAGTNVTVGTNNSTLVIGNASALGTASVINFGTVTGTVISYATDGGDSLYKFRGGTGASITFVSDRATAGSGTNHTFTTEGDAISGFGGGTFNFTSGSNNPNGTFTINLLGLSAGSVQNYTLNPTTAVVSIGDIRKTINNQSGTVVLDGTSLGNQITGAIANGPALTGGTSLAVTKSNTSTWTLSGASTYTGATLVSGGKLTLASVGSISGTSSVTVNSGATLNNNGTITTPGAVTIAGTLTGNGSISAASTTINGTVAPGNSAGLVTISAGNLALGNGIANDSLGATLNFEINGDGTVPGVDANLVDGDDGYDRLVVSSGSLAYDGTLNVAFEQTAAGSMSYDLFDFASSTGNFESININGAYSTVLNLGNSWTSVLGLTSFSFDHSSGILSLSVTAVPEPLTAAGVLLLAGRVLGRRNRASL